MQTGKSCSGRTQQLILKLLEQVNKHFQELIDASTWAQLQIELTVDGRLLHPAYPGPHSSAKVLLCCLKATREAVDALQPPWRWRRSTADFEDDWIYLIDVGISAFCYGFGSGSCSIQYEESFPPKSPDGVWSRPQNDADVTPIYPGLCTRCDLQVIFEFRDTNEPCWRLHLKTISTGETHPLATVPYIDLDLDFEDIEWPDTQFNSSIFSLITGSGFGIKSVYSVDWKRGEVIGKYPCMDISDMFLMSQDHLLTLHSREQQAEVYLAVRDVRTGHMSHRFNFPPLQTTSPPSLFYNGACQEACPLYRIGGREIASLQDPKVRVVLIHFQLEPFTKQDNDDVDVDVDLLPDIEAQLVLSIQQLLESISPSGKEHEEYHEPRTYEWDEWGPRCTRWLPTSVKPVGVAGVSGSRVLAFNAPDPAARSNIAARSFHWENGVVKYLTLLDFNPRPILRDANKSDQKPNFDDNNGTTLFENDNCRKMEYRGVSEWCDAYTNWVMVRSGLPYRAIVSKKPCQYGSAGLDDETIFGFHSGKYTDMTSFLPREEEESSTEGL